MARFFIDRPVFAWVLAIIIFLAGLLAINKLPIAQYPQIAPPAITISANYPGASSLALEESVTSVIEEEMNGLDGLLYVNSISSASGLATIELTFTPNTEPHLAQIQVQDRLKRAESRLPDIVRQFGVQVDKSVRNFLMFVSLSSENGSLDATALGNYVSSTLLDPVRRIPGVGTADLFGREYAMRIWLDFAKLNRFQLNPSDVVAAIREQNIQVASGELGGLPAIAGQQLNANITSQSRFTTVDEFKKILLRIEPNGSQIRLSDVAQVELGGNAYLVHSRVNGKPAAAIGIKIGPTANALATAQLVRAKISDLAKNFPAGMEYKIPYDASIFIKVSIKEVIKTLLEAVVLVFLVMYLFLQNLRATFIPTIVVPIALSGTFIVMLFFGFSINVLTLFGIVLAIGILVDDAIVVIENVERIMSEEGLSPRQATHKAMSQISHALIGITLVLTAVFIPMAFFGGSVGAIYKQFSLALVSSMLFSIFLALTLTPALCASLLKPIDTTQETRKFFIWFNSFFNKTNIGYQNQVKSILSKTGRMILIYLLLLGIAIFLFLRMPTAFLPEEDQGYFITLMSLPAGATEARTTKVVKQVEDHYMHQEPATQDVLTVHGYSFSGIAQNGALVFTSLKSWDTRTSNEHVKAAIGRAYAFFSGISDAMIFAINPPPIPELGTSSGFEFRLQDRANMGHEKLITARNMLLGMAAQEVSLMGVRPEGLENTAQYQIDIDKERAGMLGLNLSDINTTLSIAFGFAYVNDFMLDGKVKRVIVQGAAKDRALPQNIDNLYVRNNKKQMVPFVAFAKGHWTFGSPRLERFNGLPSVKIVGNAAPGFSTGSAMELMEKLAKRLPPGFSYEFSGQSFEERLAKNEAPMLFTLSLLAVFLCLAALYESWIIPFVAILAVPLGVLGALLFSNIFGLANDVYFKVGLLTIIGLSTKNAILIIEFAKHLQQSGKDAVSSILEAVRLRLRPILMTSIAFILGVLPLALAAGAGSASQRAIGIGVIGGMISATLLPLFFIPIFYIISQKFIKK